VSKKDHSKSRPQFGHNSVGEDGKPFDDTGEDFAVFLIETGYVEHYEPHCDCYLCYVAREWFPRWKREREHKLKYPNDPS
jgi:hypothetical protein